MTKVQDKKQNKDNVQTHCNASLRDGWVEMSADRYCIKVADGTHDSPKKTEEGKLLITSKNIKNSKLDMSSAYKISIQDYEDVNKRSKVDKWDVLLSMIGTVGEVCLIDKKPDFAIKNVGLFKCGNEVIAKWLYYYLISSVGRNYILSRLSGTTQKYITLGELRKMPIKFPKNPEEQKAIAGVLSSFDDKIELLREQNETLENIGQEVFKEWFGKYKAEDKLPDGWRVGILGEEFEIQIGRTPPRKEDQWFSSVPIGKKWISIKDIGNAGTYIFNTLEYLTNEAIQKFNIPIIAEDTTILSFKMTVGKLTITTEDMVSNEAIAQMKHLTGSLSSEFIYLYLKNLDFNSLGSTSSIVTAINSTIIKNLKIIIPERKVLEKFDKIIQSIFKKIKNNSEQIQTLSKTRDVFLPKLMSGEVKVNF